MSEVIGIPVVDKNDHMFCGVHCTFEEYSGLQSHFQGLANDEFDQGDVVRVLETMRKMAKPAKPEPEPEYTGGSSSYYMVAVNNPTSPHIAPYVAECNDIIEALGMNYAEGNAFKAIWRRCAAELGKLKKGYDNGLYDAEKIVFFGERLVAQSKAKQESK